MVKGRFAPTPSGRMHLGNVFSFLLAWLSAKSQGGHMVMRIEDLDLTRTRPEYTRQLMEDLLWLGLDWDEGPGAGAKTPKDLPPDVENPENTPTYFQSRRTAFYEEQLVKLDMLNLLYPCFCSRAQLHAVTAPHASDGTYVYCGRCRGYSHEKAAEMAKQRPPAIRVLVPDETIAFMDGALGPYNENLRSECGDFILRRSDGVFAYQLAAPADDGNMGITEVVRGRDLLGSTARQIWLMQTLGYTPPRYCHLPLLLAADGRRLAKRDKDTDMGHLRSIHKTPDAVIGRLAHLCGLTPEFSPCRATDLIHHFSWSKIRSKDIIIREGYL